MRHARLIQVEVRKCSRKSDLDEGKVLEEEAVQELLEQGHDLSGNRDTIAGIGSGLVLGAALWIFLFSVVFLAL